MSKMAIAILFLRDLGVVTRTSHEAEKEKPYGVKI